MIIQDQQNTDSEQTLSAMNYQEYLGRCMRWCAYGWLTSIAGWLLPIDCATTFLFCGALLAGLGAVLSSIGLANKQNSQRQKFLLPLLASGLLLALRLFGV